MKVALIGAGKMGLPLACQFASRGAEVMACDLRQDLVDAINRGRCPIEEPGVEEMLSAAVKAGRLRATTDVPAAIAAAEVVVVIVPAVLTPQREADLSAVLAVSEQIAGSLRRGAMVCYETTVPVGTTRHRIRPLLEQTGLQAGRDFDLVYSPERIKSGTVLKRIGQTPKVVGGLTAAAGERAAAFYGTYVGAPVFNMGSLEAAELVKLAAMVYRDVNIALANELARYAEAVGTDLEPVLGAANTDGETYLLRPGIGVGGHCTPVYPYFLIRDAVLRGTPATLVERARRINDGQADHMVARLEHALGGLRGRRVLLLGLAFRPGVREDLYSPAMLLRDELEHRGAEVCLHDPLYSEAEVSARGFRAGALTDGAEALVLVTGHPAYVQLDFASLARRGTKAVVDGRCFWAAEQVRSAGLIYIGVGRPDQPARA